jgi:hypothetical protein
MPTLSSFYGITIRMFFADHAPPHFHADYAGHEALVGLSPIRILQGSMPMRARSLVFEWAALHQEELLKAWDLCSRNQAPTKIQPLE